MGVTTTLFLILAGGLFHVTNSEAQKKSTPELAQEAMVFAERTLKTALVGPKEAAFLQVLISASIIRDPSIDASFVYDLVVRYDPDRYRNSGVGFYPVNFVDQFILWGKRLAMYTRSTEWDSGRFYLHDISTGRHAWMYTEDIRRLYGRQEKTNRPPATARNPDTLRKWLKIIHGVDVGSDVRAMSRWVRALQYEFRDEVQNGQ